MHSTKLGGNEHVFAIDTRFLEGFTYFVFVAISSGCVNMCISGPKGCQAGRFTLTRFGHQEYTKAETWDFVYMDFVTCGGGMADAHTRCQPKGIHEFTEGP
jgi:hypothetical protein